MRFPTPVFAPEGTTGSGSLPTPSPSSAPVPATPGGGGSGSSSAPSGAKPTSTAASPTQGGAVPPDVKSTPDPVAAVDSSLDWSFDEPEMAADAPIETPTVAQPSTPQVPTEQPPVAPTAPKEAVSAEPTAPKVELPSLGPKEESPLLLSVEPDKLAQDLAKNEVAILDAYAKEHFALSPEEVEALETDAVTAVPKLMAKAALKAQIGALNFMAKHIPAMIERHLKVTKVNSANEDEFYTRWKDAGIEPGKHGAMLSKLAPLYRQMNPTATKEQMIEDLGSILIMQAKLKPPVAVAGTPTNGSRPPQPSPFTPALPGAAIIPQPDDNPWGFDPREE